MGKITVSKGKMIDLLLVVGVVLLVLWALGLITSYSMGGGIHVLLTLALIFICIWFFTGKYKK